mmetsp:Transcript_6220/g.16613  ORF Transcript_6220/g.16613 Transcript_6220/m.16613 type:complete len:200 (+) Transcript_6220:269-868(+)
MCSSRCAPPSASCWTKIIRWSTCLLQATRSLCSTRYGSRTARMPSLRTPLRFRRSRAPARAAWPARCSPRFRRAAPPTAASRSCIFRRHLGPTTGRSSRTPVARCARTGTTTRRRVGLMRRACLRILRRRPRARQCCCTRAPTTLPASTRHRLRGARFQTCCLSAVCSLFLTWRTKASRPAMPRRMRRRCGCSRSVDTS